MAIEVGRLESDPLFLALTRPAMVAGVTYSWFLLQGMIWCMYFINTSDFFVVIPGAIISHALGVVICSKEPRFVELVMMWSQTCTKCKNVAYHGNTHSYDLY